MLYAGNNSIRSTYFPGLIGLARHSKSYSSLPAYLTKIILTKVTETMRTKMKPTNMSWNGGTRFMDGKHHGKHNTNLRMITRGDPYDSGNLQAMARVVWCRLQGSGEIFEPRECRGIKHDLRHRKLILGGSSHLVSRLYPQLEVGYNLLTKLDDPPSIAPTNIQKQHVTALHFFF